MQNNELRQIARNIENNDMISESVESIQKMDIFPEKIEQIPKKTLHPVVFMLNIFWMLFCCNSNLYYVYGSGQEMPTKGTVAAISLGFTVVVAIPTFLYLTSLWNLIKLTFLIDTIMIVTLAAGVAFINMMFIFDDDDDWFWTVMETAFTTELVFYSTMTRVLLVHLKWTKRKLIVFKLHAMINCIIFLVSGVYFIYIDFTYTQHMLPSFDKQVHDFMLLFIFSMFSYTYELYSKVTDLDHTGDLKYIYTIKNVDETLPKKKKSIIRQKRQSINSIKLLNQNHQILPLSRVSRISRFAKKQILS